MILTIIVPVVLGIGLVATGIILEKRDFNNGFCPHCNQRLKFFDTDSQGGRGYCCPGCNYITWVSYKSVDREYIRYYDKFQK